MTVRRFLAAAAVVALATLAAGASVAPPVPPSPISTSDLQRWLTYLASDDLEGRGNFTEGLGLAASYIADELKAMGVKPGGDHGTYFEQVRVLGVRSTNHSSITLEVNGQSRTFADGELVSFPKNVGGKRTVAFDEIEFVGYGLNAPSINHNDYQGKDVRGRLVVWLGGAGPRVTADQQNQLRRVLTGRSRYATEQALAAAVIGPERPTPQFQRGAATPAAPRPPQAAFPGAPQVQTDFTTVQKLDGPIPPAVNVKADTGDAFWELLFSNAPVKYPELKRKADAQDPLPVFTTKGVKVTVNLDADYEVVQTQLSRNVVGLIEGSEAVVKDAYVVLGAHYDHNGYQQTPPIARTGSNPQAGGQVRPAVIPGPARPSAPPSDRIFNGADDDASGCVALMATAKAFVTGAKPKRSLRFVFFTGEERGLWGSRYDADYGVTPDKVVAEINADMISRNREDKPEEENTLYVIGSDRISTELHNLTIEANAATPKPLRLDFEYNDPADPNNFYFRSDHYSYAAKGIPVVFFTTGEHPDYHRVTDSVDKTDFPKLTRVTELIYETARRLANLDHAPVRDNKGPRVGKGSSGKIGG